MTQLSGNNTVVIGGVNVDIGGKSKARLVPRDSNPGTVTSNLGGVGRNIAHNMCLLGMHVELLTAYGRDLNGQMFASSCSEFGICIDHALCIDGESTSTYLYLAGPDGEMALAISDMEICRHITPAYLEQNLPLFQNAQAVVVDTNIPDDSLCYLAKNCTAPLFADPVSTVKAKKLLPILSGIHTLKPNLMEVSLLAGIPIYRKEDIETAADILLDKGVQRIFITLGANGVFAAEKKNRLWLPNLPGNVVNATGCGDAFMAALVWAYTQGGNLHDSALAGLAAGSIALESPATINPKMSNSALRARAYSIT